MTVTLAIDCMGGDHGPSVTVPAALDFLRADRDTRYDTVAQVMAAARSAGVERLGFITEAR